jgi:F-type H+-transporting ATPase subunit a
MAHSPLTQFAIKPIFELEAFGYNISFTNSSLFMLIAISVTLLFMSISLSRQSLIPSRLQVFSESIYLLITDMLKQNVGPKGEKVHAHNIFYIHVRVNM